MFDLEQQNQEKKMREMELENEAFKRQKEDFLSELELSEEELIRRMRDPKLFSDEEWAHLQKLRKEMEEVVRKNMGAKNIPTSRGDLNLPPWALFCR
ncbi:MAG: hypothetical protein KDK48_03740 [Chlamydiia bacterium]|nr:hypothetical protein [Chlamydiia bacterium]